MKTIMTLTGLTTFAHLKEFLAGTQPFAFSVLRSKDECYQWIQTILLKFEYLTLSKPQKSIVIRYQQKMSRYSQQELTQLAHQYRQTGCVSRRLRTGQGFARQYPAESIDLLVAMDERHDTPIGPALKKLCERAWQIFGETQYARLATISKYVFSDGAIAEMIILNTAVEETKNRSCFDKLSTNGF